MEAMSGEYESKMIEAFIAKPEKYEWYKNAFATYNINGIDIMKWKWSWWAFFSGFLFLLYRKAYLASLILFLLTFVSSIIPVLGGLILMILTGGYGSYFIYKIYRTKKLEIESVIEDEDKRIETMKHAGGYNQWVVWIYAVMMVFIFGGLLMAIIIPRLYS